MHQLIYRFNNASLIIIICNLPVKKLELDSRTPVVKQIDRNKEDGMRVDVNFLCDVTHHVFDLFLTF